MQFLFVVYLFATIIPFISAAPLSTTKTTNVTTITEFIVGEYYLITSVIGPGNADKNGLYVSGYHTGTLLPTSPPLSLYL